LLVNTTVLGMVGQAPLRLNLENLPQDVAVCDIVYRPLHTDLLQNAELRGHQTITGIGMLLHQAVPGFEAWFGRRPEVDAGLEAEVLRGMA
jgi:shikimate dehydrogenase